VQQGCALFAPEMRICLIVLGVGVPQAVVLHSPALTNPALLIPSYACPSNARHETESVTAQLCTVLQGETEQMSTTSTCQDRRR
jgi:hypothetical protein